MQVVDVTRLIDERKLGWFNIQLLVWSFIAIFADGYDGSVASFAAPELVKAWHVERASFGPVFSASLFGVLFGAPLLGWVGDRFGRKKAIIIGCLVYGVFTAACAAAGSLPVLAALRFCTGIGLGGLMPTTIALNAEYAPRRFRATLIILMFSGITLGSAAPGWLAALLVPDYGWRILFLIGGGLGIVVAGCLAVALPESLKFLVLHGRSPNEVARLVRRLEPDLAIGPETRFAVPGEAPSRGVSPGRLFSGGLAAITPLLWLLFAINLMTNYFLNSWLPTVFQSAGLSPSEAALISSMYQTGGTLGGLMVSVLLDRFGMVPVAVLFALAAPLVALIGTPGLSQGQLSLVVASAGFCVLGLQFGLNALSALLYPVAFRSSGSGWAFAIGRFGSVLGPIVGGVLIGMHLPLARLFLFPAVPLAAGAVIAIVLARLCIRRFRGWRLAEAVTEAGA